MESLDNLMVPNRVANILRHTCSVGAPDSKYLEFVQMDKLLSHDSPIVMVSSQATNSMIGIPFEFRANDELMWLANTSDKKSYVRTDSRVNYQELKLPGRNARVLARRNDEGQASWIIQTTVGIHYVYSELAKRAHTFGGLGAQLCLRTLDPLDPRVLETNRELEATQAAIAAEPVRNVTYVGHNAAGVMENGMILCRLDGMFVVIKIGWLFSSPERKLQIIFDSTCNEYIVGYIQTNATATIFGVRRRAAVRISREWLAAASCSEQPNLRFIDFQGDYVQQLNKLNTFYLSPEGDSIEQAWVLDYFNYIEELDLKSSPTQFILDGRRYHVEINNKATNWMRAFIDNEVAIVPNLQNDMFTKNHIKWLIHVERVDPLDPDLVSLHVLAFDTTSHESELIRVTIQWSQITANAVSISRNPVSSSSNGYSMTATICGLFLTKKVSCILETGTLKTFSQCESSWNCQTLAVYDLDHRQAYHVRVGTSKCVFPLPSTKNVGSQHVSVSKFPIEKLGYVFGTLTYTNRRTGQNTKRARATKLRVTCPTKYAIDWAYLALCVYEDENAKPLLQTTTDDGEHLCESGKHYRALMGRPFVQLFDTKEAGEQKLAELVDLFKLSTQVTFCRPALGIHSGARYARNPRGTLLKKFYFVESSMIVIPL